MPETTEIAQERLDKILQLSYINVAASWFPNLIFEPSGLARLAHIFGWITGLAQSGVEAQLEFARALADDIFERLERLDQYGQEIVPDGYPEDILPVPAYRVSLADDGTRHGFSILFLVVAKLGTPEGDCFGGAEVYRYSKDAGHHTIRYRFAYNGGLLYHGPGGGETFAVVLGGPCLWSVHT
jgi:hypothetical protein